MAYDAGQDTVFMNMATRRRKAAIQLKHPVSQLIIDENVDDQDGSIRFISIPDQFDKDEAIGTPWPNSFRTLRGMGLDIRDILISFMEWLITRKTSIPLEKFQTTNPKLTDQEAEELQSLLDSTQQTVRKRSEVGIVEVEYSWLKTLNQYLDTYHLKTIRDRVDFTDMLSRWLISNAEEVKSYHKINQEFLEGVARLNSVSLGRQSEMFAKAITVSASIENIGVDVGPSIFESAIPSMAVPFIQYNSMTKKYYKIWEGVDGGVKPDYDYTLITGRAMKENHIYMTLWVGSGAVPKDTKNSYNVVDLNLETGVLRFDLCINDSTGHHRESVIKRVETALGMDLNIKTDKISAEFFLYDMDDFEIYAFLDFVTVDPTVYNYIHYREDKKAYPLNRRFFIHINDELTGDTGISTKLNVGIQTIEKDYIPSVLMVNGDPTSGERLCLADDASQAGPGQVVKGSKFLFVEMTTSTIEDAFKYSQIFNKLVQYVLTNQAGIKQYYQALIPEMEGVKYDMTNKHSQNLKGIKNQGPCSEGLKDLKSVDYQTFGTGEYPRTCQKDKQPKAFPAKDLAKNADLGYQIAPFPRDERTAVDIESGEEYEPRFYYYCPNEEYPHVGINKRGKPCCFVKSQINDPSSRTYKYYYQTKGPKRVTKNRLVSNKFVDLGNVANLPVILSTILQLYREETTDMARIGIPSSPNSALHSVLMAIGDDFYQSLNTDEEREGYVRGVRRYIYTLTEPSIMKQQLHDWSDQQIEEHFLDLKSFFDPWLYYRAIEEAFDINLFVFKGKNELVSNRSTAKGIIPEMEIPRHKLFNIRQYNPHRRTVILYKHWGAEADTKPNPQCELIVDETNVASGERVMLFDNQMNQFLYHTIYLNSHRVTSWAFEDDNLGSLVSQPIIYNELNFGFNQMTHQFIDAYGKARGFIADGISIFHPPSQPLSLPTTEEQTNSDYSLVIERFGQPTSMSIERVPEGFTVVTGLWFSLMGIEQGFYIPINPVHTAGVDIPIGNSHPMISVQDGPALRYKNLGKTVDVVFQLLVWLYQIYDKDRELANRPVNSKFNSGAEEFFTNHCIFGDINQSYTTLINRVDTNEIYDIEDIPEELWDAPDTVEEGLALIEQNSFGLVFQNRFYLYNNRFGSKMLYRLSRFLYQSSDDQRINNLHNIYQNVNDFTQQSDSIVVIGEPDYCEWLRHRKRNKSPYYKIRNEIKLEYEQESNPYIYHDKEHGRHYLVQNINDGKMTRALACSNYWLTEGINIGNNVGEFVDYEQEKYVIYGISNRDDSLVVKENTSQGDTQYMEILEYRIKSGGIGVYAALLPL